MSKDGSGKSDWEEFKETTGIHGFAEFKIMRSTFARTILVLFCIFLFGFCVMQLYGLCKEFSGHKPTTTVQVSRRLKLPNIGILLEASEYINKTTADPILKSLVESISDPDYENTCPDPTDLVEKPGMSTGDALKYRPTVEEIEKFNFEFKMAAPKHTDLFRGIDLIRRKKVKSSINSSSLVITNLGPLYKLNTSSTAASQVDSVVILMNMSKMTEYVHVVVGSEVEFYDPTPSLELQNGSDYVIDTRFVHYKRSERYCSKKATAGLHCVSNCVLEKKGCVPYLGEMVPTDRTYCGFGDSEVCEELFEECESECDQCSECRLCKEVTGSSQIVSSDEIEHEGIVHIRINFPDGAQVQRFIQEEAFTWFSFLSNIGGILGLCFGISVVTIYHFLYSVLVMAMGICRRKKARPEKD